MVKHGVNVTKIHSGFKFVQQAIHEDFIKGNIEKCKNAKSASRKNLYKFLNNSIFGKFLLDNRKYNTNTKLVTEEWHFQKLLNSCSVQDVIYISKEALQVKQSKPFI